MVNYSVVENGKLQMLDVMPLIEKHNRIAREMVKRAGGR